MVKSNFHVHANWCDGKSTVKELVESAIEKGFSGHSYLENAKEFSLYGDRFNSYVQEVNKAKETYFGKIKIFLGIEQDCFSLPPTYPFEYMIGSVHNIKKNGEYLFFDYGQEETERIIKEVYGGKYEKDFVKVKISEAEMIAPLNEEYTPHAHAHADATRYEAVSSFSASDIYFMTFTDKDGKPAVVFFEAT